METGTLYLCATPIGNLEDISMRTLSILKQVDLIACEDTRHSLKLLNHFEISKPLTSYHEHNKAEKGEVLLQKMKEGTNIALVSDAGTPAISDPGEDLVKKCIESGIKVVPIPGPAALISALIVSGQDTARFTFEGFLPVNRRSRDERLKCLENETRTMIFYEAPHKLVRTLDDMYEVFGDRSITIVKEITKIHESVTKTTLGEAVKHFEQAIPKGEFVLVLAGKSEQEIKSEAEKAFENMSITEHVDSLIAQGIDKKEAIKQVARLRNLPKRDVYNAYMNKEED